MKIAMCCPTSDTGNYGGIESGTMGLINELIGYDDIEVVLITTTSNKDKTVGLAEKIETHLIYNHQLPFIIGANTFIPLKVKQLVQEIHPDIVHAHGTAPLYGYPAVKCGFPSIVTIGGIVFEEAKLWEGLLGNIRKNVYTTKELEVLNNADVVVSLTKYVQQKIMNICSKKTIVIPYGVDESFFNIPNLECENRLLYVGGIEPRKGLLDLLKALTLVKVTIPDIDLHVVGSVRNMEYYNRCIKFMHENNLQSNVTFRGKLDPENLRREYAECSVFTFPSIEESQGIVLLEAMAAGKPIVTINRSAMPYIVVDGSTGYLIEYQDYNSMSQKIIALASDRKLRAKMSFNGVQNAMQYSASNVARSYLRAYENLIASQ